MDLLASLEVKQIEQMLLTSASQVPALRGYLPAEQLAVSVHVRAARSQAPDRIREIHVPEEKSAVETNRKNLLLVVFALRHIGEVPRLQGVHDHGLVLLEV